MISSIPIKPQQSIYNFRVSGNYFDLEIIIYTYMVSCNLLIMIILSKQL